MAISPNDLIKGVTEIELDDKLLEITKLLENHYDTHISEWYMRDYIDNDFQHVMEFVIDLYSVNVDSGFNKLNSLDKSKVIIYMYELYTSKGWGVKKDEVNLVPDFELTMRKELFRDMNIDNILKEN